MANFQTVCNLGELPEGEGKTVIVAGKEVAVFRCGAEVFAIDDMCPHMGASLAGGAVENGVVTCPWHGSQFNVHTGAVSAGPAEDPIRTYPVEESNGEIRISA